MASVPELTFSEQQVLLAILRLQPSGYGVSIRDEIKARTGKEHSFGSIYAVLERLERNGMVVSREGEPTNARGGRRKLYFQITGTGQEALRASLNAVDAMRAGLKVLTPFVLKVREAFA